MHPRPDDPRAAAAVAAAGDAAAASSVDTLDDLPLWSAPFGLRLLDAAVRGPAAAVLDVGCGTGFPLVELAQRLMPRDRCVGVDPWRPALARARRKVDAAAAPARVVAAACEALPFRGASFDLIVSNNGFNNVTDIDASFRECARVAVPGARLLMTMNTAG